jgi:hypothetical protein
MSSLESRKQMLLAESELNRERLKEDFAALSADVRALTDRARSFESVASTAAVLVSGLSAFRRAKPVETDARPSWLRSILKGAGLASNLWLALRSRRRHRPEN